MFLYAVLKRIQDYTDEELTPGWWKSLLTQYRQEIGEIPGLYFDPRGHLKEPHGGETVPLGTREVEGYRFPDYLFGSILFIEKEGFNPCSTPVAWGTVSIWPSPPARDNRRAVRACSSGPRRGTHRLFVFTDADHSGYVIAKAIAGDRPHARLWRRGHRSRPERQGRHPLWAGTEDYTRKGETAAVDAASTTTWPSGLWATQQWLAASGNGSASGSNSMPSLPQGSSPSAGRAAASGW